MIYLYIYMFDIEKIYKDDTSIIKNESYFKISELYRNRKADIIKMRMI